MTPAQEQFNRMKRYLVRMERMGATDEDTDDMYTFFVYAWHLADWASSDPSLNPRRSLNELKALDITDDIKLCGDIADGIKHYLLTKPPRIPGQVTFKDIRVTPGSGHPAEARYRFTFADGSTKDALDFARQIVTDWENILKRYRVSI